MNRFFISLLFYLVFVWANPLERLEQAFEQALREIPEYANSQISVNVLLRENQQNLIPAKASLKILLPPKKDISQVTYARVLVYDQDKLLQTLRLRFLVQIFSDVYCAKTNLEKGTLLSTENFYLAPRNILQYKQLAGPGFIIKGKKLLTELKADQPLYTWMAKFPPAVEVGEIITVTVYSGDVRLDMEARALQQGYPGDKILVQLTSTKKVFKALIKDRRKFEIYL